MTEHRDTQGLWASLLISPRHSPWGWTMWDPEVPLESRPSPEWLALWAKNWPQGPLHSKIHLESDSICPLQVPTHKLQGAFLPILMRGACVTPTLETNMTVARCTTMLGPCHTGTPKLAP